MNAHEWLHFLLTFIGAVMLSFGLGCLAGLLALLVAEVLGEPWFTKCIISIIATLAGALILAIEEVMTHARERDNG